MPSKGKSKTVYVCQECGGETAKWQGQCPECGQWNTMVEQLRVPSPQQSGADHGRPVSLIDVSISSVCDIDVDEEARYATGYSELDRVLGSGIVKGSVVLLSGDPGIGKSTLLLQICKELARSLKVLYVSGEESVRQIKLRAIRLEVDSPSLLLAACTDIYVVRELIQAHRPDIVMVDSIQTMYMPELNSTSGSVSQVRECTRILMQAAKGREIPIFIVGHVNKDGAIAGPRVLEHMVDTVLYFEGERQLSYRILRAVKNRFGSTNEIGVFEMTQSGLMQVENPSAALLAGRPVDVSGTCVACIMEGTRPILTEVQALVSKTGFGTPRRTSAGFDYNRTALLIAVLEKRCGYFFGNLDVYVNVVGGLRLDEPCADLPVALALASNLLDRPIPHDVMAIGELGLTGELRAATQIQGRIREAYRMGLRRFIVPKQSAKGLDLSFLGDIRLVPAANLADAIRAIRD